MDQETHPRKVVLVGNPNVGKSVFFGVFTGRYATVSNYPGTTVEVSRGSARIKGRSVSLIDSPGINSVIPTSEDERVTRDILVKEKLDGVVQVIDAKNLRRGLLVTLQLAEMRSPLVVALNMFDEAGERGITIDIEKLGELTGIDVVPTIATQRWGFDRLKDKAFEGRVSTLSAQYPAPIEEGINAIEKLLPSGLGPKKAVAIMLLSGDDVLFKCFKKAIIRRALKRLAK